MEFIWRPEFGYQVSHEPKVKVAKFGNGYEQRVKDGINNQLKTYQLSFIKTAEIGKKIDLFLQERGAVRSFLWLTSDDNTKRRFVCRSWQTTPNNTVWNISCTFEEVVA
ncbi:TPA: phage tail protein [Proteus mirabilis]|uniref:phage tail protein n=1 Tax=Proteus sp. STS61-E TaxID=3237301 RepID=UPI000B4E6C13|nr:phage tail protein [Proteus mirabilis]